MANRQAQKTGQENGQRNQGDRKPPAKEFRLGQCRCSIWRNSGDQGDWFSVTFSRSYTVGQGANLTWKSATSYGRDQLLVVGELARMAAIWIFQNPPNKNGDDGGGSDTNGNGPDEPPPY